MDLFELTPLIIRCAAVPFAILTIPILPLVALAQGSRITLTPSSVDMTKPTRIVVRLLKADNSVDTELMAKVKKITVDGVPITPIASGTEPLIFDPPRVTTPGVKVTLLFDTANNQLAQGELEYIHRIWLKWQPGPDRGYHCRPSSGKGAGTIRHARRFLLVLLSGVLHVRGRLDSVRRGDLSRDTRVTQNRKSPFSNFLCAILVSGKRMRACLGSQDGLLTQARAGRCQRSSKKTSA